MDKDTIKYRLKQVMHVVMVVVIIVAAVFFSINYATFSHSGVTTYLITIEYNPDNRGDVIIATGQIGLDGSFIPLPITGLDEDTNYSFWSAPCWDHSYNFTNKWEVIVWIQILDPNQTWILASQHLNETVWVARIYLI